MLAMGRLLSELQLRMSKKVRKEGGDPLKMSVMSCHDTSIAGLCTTLDVFDNKYVIHLDHKHSLISFKVASVYLVRDVRTVPVEKDPIVNALMGIL